MIEAEAGAAPLMAAQSQFGDVPTKCIDPTCPAGGLKGCKAISPYSDLYRIISISYCIHIQVKVQGPYHIHMYLTIGISYFLASTIIDSCAQSTLPNPLECTSSHLQLQYRQHVMLQHPSPPQQLSEIALNTLYVVCADMCAAGSVLPAPIY
jgi:hypothetical protein